VLMASRLASRRVLTSPLPSQQPEIARFGR
jgi:hypothetical protein